MFKGQRILATGHFPSSGTVSWSTPASAYWSSLESTGTWSWKHRNIMSQYVQWKYNESHTCNLECSSSHILKSRKSNFNFSPKVELTYFTKRSGGLQKFCLMMTTAATNIEYFFMQQMQRKHFRRLQINL